LTSTKEAQESYKPKKYPVKITVVKRFSAEDVFGPDHDIRQVNGELVTKCNFEEGREFIVEDVESFPEGFCMWAWRDIYKDLSVLFFGGNFNRPYKGKIYVSCSDGRKPVVFKLERIEDYLGVRT